MSNVEPSSLILKAWGEEVGELRKDPVSGNYQFKYNPNWVEGGVELSPLYMPNSIEVYEFPDLNPETYRLLPPMIADALPDKFGSTLVELELGSLPKIDLSPLLRLSRIGQYGLGAMSFHPSAEPTTTEPKLNLLQLASNAKVTLGLLKVSEIEQRELASLIAVGSVAGGARAKIVVSYNPQNNKYLAGHLPPAKGYESWLLKLDGVPVGGDFPKIEFAYYCMAQSCGIDMSPSRLFMEGGLTHFMSKRFDRGADGERIHMQTLCAMAEMDFNLVGTNTYEQYFQVIRELGMGQDDVDQAFRRAVFNIVTCNRDDHSKNFSFLLRKGGSWELAPAYDVTHAHNADGLWTKDSQMGINGKFTAVTLNDLYEVGKREGVENYEDIVADVLQAAYAWPAFAKQAGVSDTKIDSIEQDIAENLPE